MHPCLAPEQVAAGLSPEQMPHSLLQLFCFNRIRPAAFPGAPAGVMNRFADFFNTNPGILLHPGALPLNKPDTAMVSGIPGSCADNNLTMGPVLIQIV